MLHVHNVQVRNLEQVFTNLRNPFDSEYVSDSLFTCISSDEVKPTILNFIFGINQVKDSLWPNEADDLLDYFMKNGISEEPITGMNKLNLIGPEDMKLAKELIRAGHGHDRFLEQIKVNYTLTAPIYFWKDAESYLIYDPENFLLDIEKLLISPITEERFTFDYFQDFNLKYYVDEAGRYLSFYDITIRMMEDMREKYLDTHDLKYWRALLQILPSSLNQTCYVTTDYRTLRYLYLIKKNNKLIEWETFRQFIEELPYAEQLIL